MPGVTTAYQTGNHASRPANGAGCILYSCTTHGLVYRDDGTSWATFLTLPTGAAAHAASHEDGGADEIDVTGLAGAGGGGGGSLSIGDWSGATEVTPTGTVVWAEQADGISGHDMLTAKFSGISASDVAAILKSMGTLAIGDSIETSLRIWNRDGTVDTFMAGLVLADGTTSAANAIAFLFQSGAASTTFFRRSGTLTNMAANGGEITARLYPVLDRIYMRCTWVSANTWRMELSPNGQDGSWDALGIADQSVTLTPTHMGLGVSNWGSGSVIRIAMFDHFRTIEP